MKNLHYTIIFVLFALCSCKKQNEIVTFPIDKLYIFEYQYTLPEEFKEPYPKPKFCVVGFSEFDKDFSIKYVRRLFYNNRDFYSSKDIVPDSLRSKISNILLKYQTDTTFLYQGEPGSRIYDGNAYRFIIQKHDQKYIKIKFEPRFLPEDLKFIYSYLYEDRKMTKDISTYNELFEMFENQAKDDTLKFPPLMLKSTIKFTPPVIKRKK